MSRYDASYSGLRELLNSDFMKAEMLARAEKVKAAAEAAAPVMEDGPHPGRYKAAFTVSAGTHGGEHHDRAFGRVENHAPEAFYVEYGTRNNPRYRTLGRALDAAGQ